MNQFYQFLLQKDHHLHLFHLISWKVEKQNRFVCNHCITLEDCNYILDLFQFLRLYIYIQTFNIILEASLLRPYPYKIYKWCIIFTNSKKFLYFRKISVNTDGADEASEFLKWFNDTISDNFYIEANNLLLFFTNKTYKYII